MVSIKEVVKFLQVSSPICPDLGPKLEMAMKNVNIQRHDRLFEGELSLKE